MGCLSLPANKEYADMRYVEFVPADPRIFEQLSKIKDAVNSEDISESVSERSRNLRVFIEAWGPMVTKRLIDAIRDIIKVGEFSSGEMPTIPDIAAYDLKNAKGLNELHLDYVDRWNKMINWFQNKYDGKLQQIRREPIDKFVEMTEMIKHVLAGLEPVDHKRYEVQGGLYVFIPKANYNGRMICDVENPKHVDHFREVAKAGVNTPSNIAMWRFYESEQEMKVSPPIRERVTEPQNAIMTDRERAALATMNELGPAPPGMIAHNGAFVPMVQIDGEDVPKWNRKDGKYDATFLKRMERGHLWVIAGKFPEAERHHSMTKRDLITIILEHQGTIRKKRSKLKGKKTSKKVQRVEVEAPVVMSDPVEVPGPYQEPASNDPLGIVKTEEEIHGNDVEVVEEPVLNGGAGS